jgi:hypothetical protein
VDDLVSITRGILLPSLQVFSQLPVQKLSGYSYKVEDSDPYPCRPEEEMEVPPPPVPKQADDLEATPVPDRKKRSFWFGPNNDKNDVYNIFKVRVSNKFVIVLSVWDMESVCVLNI